MGTQTQAVPELQTRAFVEDASEALDGISDGREDTLEISLRTRFLGFALRIIVVCCEVL